MVAILFTFFGYLLGRWEPNQNKDIVALKSSTSNEPSIKTHLPPLNSLDKDRNIVSFNSEEFSQSSYRKPVKNTTSSQQPKVRKVIESTSQLLDVKNNVVTLDTERLGAMNITELRAFIDLVKFSAKTSETVAVERKLIESMDGKLDTYETSRYRDAACNNEMCTLEISADNREELDNVVDGLMFDPDVSDSMDGGFIKVYTEGGQHFATFMGIRKGDASIVRIAN